ncbi:MAG: hypothetical protein DRJ66_00430 [Thermoprotei archaeon]|nr:MAG: hypothetical protein DRJ66_00430 [Thermoprotei archaeon]RLF20408.1 MAG: hypothetical protein DRZ82_02490 [Thermoprotei archaeon]
MTIRRLPNGHWLVVVYRGKYWLDGVAIVRCTPSELPGVIKKLKYYGETRLIIVDDPNISQDIMKSLHSSLNVPVIAYSEGLKYAFGISPDHANNILKFLSLNGIPEPIRVSRIISRDLFSLMESGIYYRNQDNV